MTTMMGIIPHFVNMYACCISQAVGERAGQPWFSSHSAIIVLHEAPTRPARSPQECFPRIQPILTMLSQELSAFIAGMWVELEHPAAPGSTYWHNSVLSRTQWEPPSQPQALPLDDGGTQLLLEDEADFVMPSRSALQAAGRWDLHHAVVRHGGYQQVCPAHLKAFDRDKGILTHGSEGQLPIQGDHQALF